MVRLLAYVHRWQQEEISLTNLENTKWCRDIFTKLKPQYTQNYSLSKRKFTTSIKCLGLNTKFEAKPKIRRRFPFFGILAQHSLKWSLTLTFCHTFLYHPTCRTRHTNQIREQHIYVWLRENTNHLYHFFFLPIFHHFFLSTNYDMSRVLFFSILKFSYFIRNVKKKYMVRISFWSRRNQSQQRRICCYAPKDMQLKHEWNKSDTSPL